MFLFKCKNCGKIFKSPDGKYTDFGDKIYSEIDDDLWLYDDEDKCNKCPNCGVNSVNSIIETEDWIADLVFKVKG